MLIDKPDSVGIDAGQSRQRCPERGNAIRSVDGTVGSVFRAPILSEAAGLHTQAVQGLSPPPYCHRLGLLLVYPMQPSREWEPVFEPTKLPVRGKERENEARRSGISERRVIF